jgi:hypothetical protein
MPEVTFDIFAGDREKSPLWLEAVEGLSNARERIRQITAQTPGSYFLFNQNSSSTKQKRNPSPHRDVDFRGFPLNLVLA